MSEDPVKPAAGASTLVGVLSWRGLNQPERPAYTFLLDGEADEVHFSYGELHRRALAIAARLRRTAAPGERALLLYPPGLDFIAAYFGCLYAHCVAVPAYPPRPNRPLERLQAINSNAGATVALTLAPLLSKIKRRLADAPELADLKWLPTDEVSDDEAEPRGEEPVDADSLAFLQYTSGSTGAPKGVMVSHANLMENERAIRSAFRQTEHSVTVGWLPLYHDMGLIGNVLQPLFNGGRCILMSPAAFLQSPVRWLQAISRYRATTSGGPNFAYELCVRKVTREQQAQLDLSSWSVAFNGAEPVRWETLERFAAKFEGCGFRRQAYYPCYGLAEATLLVTGGRADATADGPPALPPARARVSADELAAAHRAVEVGADEGRARAVVSCGRKAAGQEVLVVNPRTLTRCEPDVVGEIWVGGPSVTRGYWNRPAETEETFGARLSDTGEGPFLRTGDLGFLRDGELYVTGRLKDLIIVRGVNHYPQDIELTAERTHPALRPGGGAAFSVEAGGEERLVVVQEVDRRPDVDLPALMEKIRWAVGEEYEVQVYCVVLVRPGTVPKTSSGKTRRGDCRTMFQNDALDVVAQWRESLTGAQGTAVAAPPPAADDVETWLASQLAAQLGVHVGKIDIRQPITRYGVDSLAVIELQEQIETSCGVVMPVSDFFQEASVVVLASEIRRRKELPPGPPLREVRPVETSGAVHPTSPGQRALWFLHQLAPESPAYNIARAIRITSPLDVPALERAFVKLLSRHESLRTSFKVVNDEPLQEIHERPELPLRVHDAARWTEAALDEFLSEEARRPFDLRRAPLLRAVLLRRSETDHVLLLTVHHIVSDLRSLEVLTDELGDLYSAERDGTEAGLPPPGVRYADYVYWQNEMLSGPEGERLYEYWRKQLEGAPGVLNLVTDRPRPPVQTFNGDAVTFKLGEALSRRLRELARSRGVTLYAALLAAFEVLLHRYTQQEDMLVGSLTAGRSRAALSSAVGYFVNPVALRARLSRGLTFAELLRQAQETVSMALEHQDYPFPLLVERLQPDRSPSRSPLFQVMFVLQKPHRLKEAAPFVLGEPGTRAELGGLVVEPVPLKLRVAQFDLSLMMVEWDGTLTCSLEYNADLFERATAERVAAHYARLLEAAAADPGRRAGELPLLTGDERRQALAQSRGRRADYPAGALLHEEFERQAARTPDATALVFGAESLTYAQLDARAEALARLLRRRGVGPESLVGLVCERSVEMVVALVGVLKAGGAYVPLDPEYPAERLRQMVEDSRPVLLLTHAAARDAARGLGVEVVALDALAAADAEDEGAPACARPGGAPDNTAYVIYTSGSTGVPKGVGVTHAGICNRLLWMQGEYGLTAADRVLQKTPYGFDVSVWEFFWPLLTGATLVVARPGGHRDSSYLVKLINEQKITTLHFVPSMLRIFLEEPEVESCVSLRRVICSGEALPVEVHQRFFGRLSAELHNLYGPTEASVDVTFWKCRPDDELRSVPIGAPIANTQIYILDEGLDLVPAGVAGQLFIGGVGLARGYLNRPALTAERFIPNPFNDTFGGRLYATGDLARRRPDGQVEFLGRIDHQVKIRGFRIELGEVETVLGSHPSVADVVVTARADESGEQFLAAYVVASQEPAPSAAQLRRFLQERLPDYAAPRAFVFMDSLPLTTSGKLDRKRLPPPGTSRPGVEAGLVAPRGPLEETLAEIWKDVLKIEEVGAHDNFFELGGYSLLATRVLSRVREAFDVELPLSAVFESPTVAGLALAVTRAQLERGEADEITRLLEELEGLPDEEAKRLLDGRQP
nr:AMP-dependent synthetase and ligase [uncultured bacterium]